MTSEKTDKRNIDHELCKCNDNYIYNSNKNRKLESCSIEDEGCGCCENGEIDNLKTKSFIIGIILFIINNVILLISEIQLPEPILLLLFFISYLLIGKDILITACRNILNGKIFDENFLMSIASLGAFAIGEYPEAIAVMLFYKFGEYMQSRAVAHSRRSIEALIDIRPDTANRKTEKGIEVVAAEEINVNDIIVIKVGEKVPLDGEVIEGSSTVDTQALTGESMPQDVSIGSNILSGSINGQGFLTLRVTSRFSDSTASKIIELVKNASSKKAKTETFITKFARYYTPAVVGISVALAFIPAFVFNIGTFSEWLYRALIFLVVSCPCALVISIPLGFFGGIGAASSKGILVKGSNYLEALSSADTVVFDKTGTLTSGVFKVIHIGYKNGYTKEQVLEYGAYAENHSTHPIAVSIKSLYSGELKNAIDESKIIDIVERAGLGVKVNYNGRNVVAGNARLMSEEGIAIDLEEHAGTVVYIAVDGVFAGTIVIADEERIDSKDAIAGLRKVGIKLVAMLTGDSKKISDIIGSRLNIDQVYAELLPHQKVEILEKLISNNKEQNETDKKGKIIFVGDGINDAPVLARADIGIAMGGIGSDAAIEAADIVIMNDEPSKIISAILIAKKTRKIVWQNIALALSVKGFVILLGAFGIATMWEAVFADVGVAILAVLNSVRAGRI